MSMPSSSCDVATTHGSRPDLSSSSTTRALLPRHRPVVGPGDDRRSRRRRSRTARSASAGNASRRRSARRSAARPPRPRARSAGRSAARPAAGSWRTRSSSGAAAPGPAAVAPPRARSTAAAPCPAADPTTSSSDGPAPGARRAPRCPAPAPRPRPRWSSGSAAARPPPAAPPARNVATSSTGRTVADSPIRCAGASSSASSRSSDSARCAPRLVPATACTSSMITVRTPRSDSRAAEVSSRNSDSGVVTSTSGGVRANSRRSSAGVSPVRMPDRDRPAPAARAAAPPAGSRSAARAGCARRRPPAPSAARRRAPGSGAVGSAGGGSAASRSSAHRNAASVLPEPVGATTSACRPACAAAHAPSCAGVGAAKAPRNQSRVAGEKPSSALTRSDCASGHRQFRVAQVRCPGPGGQRLRCCHHQRSSRTSELSSASSTTTCPSGDENPVGSPAERAEGAYRTRYRRRAPTGRRYRGRPCDSPSSGS